MEEPGSGGSSPLRTVLYSCMLTVCTIVCVVICVNQFNLYWSEPAAMTVTLQQDVMFPAFTLCSSRKFSRSRVQELGLLSKRGTDVDWDLFPANASVSDFWHEAGTQLHELVSTCNRGQCSPDARGQAPAGRWTPLPARNGMCYTFVANQTLVERNEEKLDITFHLYTKDYFNKLDKYFVDVYFHGGEPAIVHSRYSSTPDHPKVKVNAGDITTVDVTGKAAIFKSLNRRYCKMTKGYTAEKCREKCMWAHESHQIGCRAPWMIGLADPLPLCNTSLNAMISLKAIPRGSATCPHCPPSCNNERYSVQVTTTMARAGMERAGMAKLMAVWPYQQELSTEELTYGLSALISDVGGNMSLLLGVSVISIVELTEAVLRFCRAWLHRRLRRVRSRSSVKPQTHSAVSLGRYVYTPPVKNGGPLSAAARGLPPPPPPQYQSPPASMRGPEMPRVVSAGFRTPWAASRPVTALRQMAESE